MRCTKLLSSSGTGAADGQVGVLLDIEKGLGNLCS